MSKEIIPVPVRATRQRLARVSAAFAKHYEGMTWKKVAEFFGVSERTIYNDKKLGEELIKAALAHFDLDNVLGKLYDRLSYDIDRYIRLAATAKSEQAQVAYHKMAQTAVMNLIKFLQETGLLALKREVAGEFDIPQEAFANPKVRELYLKIMIAVREGDGQGR